MIKMMQNDLPRLRVIYFERVVSNQIVYTNVCFDFVCQNLLNSWLVKNPEEV